VTDLGDVSLLPKVILHDHLDGGLRPQTVIELAAESGYQHLPATDVDDLADWFYQGGSSSLELYLESFDHTLAVMQTAPAIERVAYEAVEDLAADGVVYAELRMAPSLCTAGGLVLEEVIEAVLRGIDRGERDFDLPTRFIVDAMRQEHDSEKVVAAALQYRADGVVGFDLAGPEAGFPASDHRSACEMARDGGLCLTIHAGEGDGVASIAGALEVGAQRLGHGVRIIEDVAFEDGDILGFGRVATAVHSRGIPLEVCPTSNLHTGMYPDAAHHPLGLLHRAGFQVTLNTDNRLMSAIDPSDEFELAGSHMGMTRADLRMMTLRAVDAAFCDDATREAVRQRVIDGYS
jgi:adenosine deaminase